MKSIKDWFFGIFDEFRDRVQIVTTTFLEGFKTYWNGRGGWIRKILDLIFVTAIAILAPPVAVALAAANFIDGTDTMTAVVTATVAFIALDLLAMFAMEVVIILGAFQFSRVTTRYLEHVSRRKAIREAEQGLHVVA